MHDFSFKFIVCLVILIRISISLMRSNGHLESYCISFVHTFDAQIVRNIPRIACYEKPTRNDAAEFESMAIVWKRVQNVVRVEIRIGVLFIFIWFRIFTMSHLTVCWF